MFSDAAGEDEKIDAAQQGDVCANYLAHGNGKDIQRKSGLRIVRAGAIFKAFTSLSPEERAKRPL